MELPEMVQAGSFKEAVRLLSDPSSFFDIILLDLSLPDKDGHQLVNDMLSLVPDFPIIILTGYSDMKFAAQAISQGIEDYLLKDDLTPMLLFKSITYSIERKKSNAALKESERQYSNLFHLSPQPMWVYDTDTFRFVEVNKAAVSKYGFSEEEFLQMTIFDIRPAEDVQKVRDTVGEIRRANPDVFTGRFRHLNKEGQIFEVEVYSTAINTDSRSLRSVIAYDITEKMLYEQLITQAIIKTQEEERYEIGSELHDNICQILAMTQMNLDKLRDNLSAEKITWYENAKNTLITALEEIRNLSHQLAPAFYNELTLEESFRKLIKSFNAAQKYKIIFSFEDELNDKSRYQEMQLNLYRILQEQLRNIEKYAYATEIRIFLFIKKDNLYMTTIDNGVGFVMDPEKHGIGFANMQRRVELYKGDIEINTAPGKGCKIAIAIPFH
jgi:PAS domain S-box-containing protein